MFTKTGWYNMGGKSVWVQRFGDSLRWWTIAEGWNDISDEQEKILEYLGVW